MEPRRKWLEQVGLCVQAAGVTFYEFHLRIPAAQYLDFYRGTMRQVIAKTITGQKVQFPASLLQQYVGHDGIHGRFVLTVGENNKCVSLERAKA